MAFRIYVPEPVEEAGIAYLRERGHDVVLGSGTPPAETAAHLRKCDALFLRTLNVTAAMLERAPKLKVIARNGVGVDNVDLAAARRLGIVVTNSPVGNVEAVAEHTLGFIIAAARHFHWCDRAVRGGNFALRAHAVGCGLAGRTLGILGMGRIGSRVARKAALGLDMKILAFDPFADPAPSGFAVEWADDRDALFRRADFVSVHLPLSDATRKGIGDREFGLMKPSARFINCCRGDLVDEAALVRALAERRIAGAALDTFDPEPPLPDHPLFALDTVILSPHVAGASKEAAVRVALDAARGIDDVLNGRAPEFPVVVP